MLAIATIPAKKYHASTLNASFGFSTRYTRRSEARNAASC